MNTFISLILALTIALVFQDRFFKAVTPKLPRLKNNWSQYTVFLLLAVGLLQFFDPFLGYLATHTPVILETRQIIMMHLTAALIATPIAFMLSVWYYIQPPDHSNKTLMITVSTSLGVLNLVAIYEFVKILIAFFMANPIT